MGAVDRQATAHPADAHHHRTASSRLFQASGMVVVKSRLQCAGLNRHEAEDESSSRERSSDPLGPESCGAAREGAVEALTGDRRGGY